MEENTKNNTDNKEVKTTDVNVTSKKHDTTSKQPFNRNDSSRNPTKRPRRRSKFGKNKVRQEFDKRVLQIRRVARVVAGGRRFSFSATVLAGNRNGMVGIGIANGSDTAIAVEKAYNQAKKHMVKIPLTDDHSIAHDIQAKYSASVVALRPSSGVVAGGAVRSVVELVGIKNINTKILSRSKCHINNAKATIKALEQLI